MSHNTFHVIKDPVHGTMQFTATEEVWVKPFIDSPHLQRLRHIKQLGLGDFIFPGAVHTRFNHSLGCCYVASQIAQKIHLADEERQLVMIACLLHDIGHGPFSHTFEGVFQEKCIRHEDWTPYFLADYHTECFFIQYNRLNPRYHLTEEKFHSIEKMIMHQTVSKPVLADIVSSQLDADRLDYLLRDSHFCGVRYGEFDFDWMLHCMAIIATETGERLGITYKGIGVVEHYLMARRLMIRNIYHAQKKLALEFFLVQLLITLAESLEDESTYQSVRQTRLGRFLIAVNQLNQTLSRETRVDQHKRDFLATHFTDYSALCDYDVLSMIKQLCDMNQAHPATQLAERLYHRRMPKVIRLDPLHLTRAESIVAAFKLNYRHDFQDWQLAIVHTPHQAYSREDAPILVMNEQQTVQSISDLSFMIRAISDQLEQLAFLCVDQLIVQDKRVVALMEALQLGVAVES